MCMVFDGTDSMKTGDSMIFMENNRPAEFFFGKIPNCNPASTFRPGPAVCVRGTGINMLKLHDVPDEHQKVLCFTKMSPIGFQTQGTGA